MKRLILTGYLAVAATVVLTLTGGCNTANDSDALPKDSPLKPVETEKQGEFVPPGQEGPEKRGR